MTYFCFVQVMVRGAGQIPLSVVRSFPCVCEVLQLQIFYVSCEEQPTQLVRSVDCDQKVKDVFSSTPSTRFVFANLIFDNLQHYSHSCRAVELI